MSINKQSAIKILFHKTRRVFAKTWSNLLNPTIIAITGSQGKTTTSYILSQLLPEAIITDTNLDTLYNVPITALKIRPWKKLAIFELGVDHVNEMDLHLDIVKPRISIITGISAVHADDEHFGSLENIIIEKSKLIKVLNKNDFAILNYDDINVREMSKLTEAKIIYYGTNKEKCSIYFDINKISVSKSGTSGSIFDGDQKININTKLLGKHQFYNIAAAFAAYKITDEIYYKKNKSNLENFSQIIKEIEPLKGRMSIENGPMGSIIFNDSLRANPTSTIAGLNILKDINDKSKKIIILGEMGELGNLEEFSHREVGKVISELNPDLYIGIGELQKFTLEEAIKNGFDKNKAFNTSNPIEAANIAKNIIKNEDIIYLKGSLHRHLERFLMILNKEEVSCGVTSCPFYNQCQGCKYRHIGYISD